MTHITNNYIFIPSEIFVLISNYLDEPNTIFLSRVCGVINRAILNDKNTKNRIANYKVKLAEDVSKRMNCLIGRHRIWSGLLVGAEDNLGYSTSCYRAAREKLFSSMALWFSDRLVTNDQINEFIEFITQDVNAKAVIHIDNHASNKVIELRDAAVIAFKDYKVAEQEDHRLRQEEKIVENNLKNMKIRLDILCGPTGFDGLIDQAFKKMQSMQDSQSQKEFDTLVQELEQIAVFGNNGVIIDGEIYTAKNHLKILRGTCSDGLLLNQAFSMEGLIVKRNNQIHTFALSVNIPFNIAYLLIAIYAASDQNLIQEIEAVISTGKNMEKNEAEILSLRDEFRKLEVYHRKLTKKIDL